MSAPKSISKRRRLERKRNRKRQVSARRKRTQSSAPMEWFDCFDDGPIGGVKMSEVLIDFVDPLAGSLDDGDAYQRLLALGVVAWNAALAPEGLRERMVDGGIAEVMAGATPEARSFGKDLIGRLIDRKLRYFAEFQRPIAGFELTDIGDGYHLSVISALG